MSGASELSPYAERLARVMTGPPSDDARFVGEAVDLRRVNDRELGALLALAWQVDEALEPSSPAVVTGVLVRSAVRDRSPVLEPAVCVDLFAALARRAQERPDDGEAVQGSCHRLAAGAMLRCAGPLPSELAGPARVLARQPGPSSPGHWLYARAALAALSGPDVEAEVAGELRATVVDAGLLAEELETVLGLDDMGRAVVSESDRWRDSSMAPLPDLLDLLAGCGEYAHFARRALEAADARIADIHAGGATYQADKAFTMAEADVLWRACQVAGVRDEPWLGELLARLLPGVVVAPTSAKTVPSQSAASALAQAVEAQPTPEAVAALRQARRVVRHAGLARKLDRLLRSAEKGLARRPLVAVRLPASPPTRAQLGTAVRALEGGYALDVTYPVTRWRNELAGLPHLRDVVGRLIWEVETSPGQWAAGLADAGHGAEDRMLVDVTGDAVAVLSSGGQVRLWHPVRVSAADRRGWRDIVVARQLDQPFRQAFRECYVVDDLDSTATEAFAGHVVAIRPLLGLAVRQGWRGDNLQSVLYRELGAWRVSLVVRGPLFPGANGFGDIGAVHLERRDGGGWHPARFGQASPVLVSEALRGVDLLVSAAAFGVENDPEQRRDPRRWETLARLADQPLGETARIRRAALQHVLAEDIAAGTVSFGERHVHVGPYSVHLATARVTRDGEPVPVDLPHSPTAAVLPWLPYDEQLLERIARTVVTLAAEAGQG